VEALVSRLVEVSVMSVVMLVTVKLTVPHSLLDSVLDRERVFSELPEVLEEVLPTVVEVVMLLPLLWYPGLATLLLAFPLSTVLEEVLLLEVLLVSSALPRKHLKSVDLPPGLAALKKFK
jgi:hypothetical protein